MGPRRASTIVPTFSNMTLSKASKLEAPGMALGGSSGPSVDLLAVQQEDGSREVEEVGGG